MSTAAASDQAQDEQANNVEALSSDSEDDPIGKLLKSNTAIFGKDNQILSPGTLAFTKLKNANSSN